MCLTAPSLLGCGAESQLDVLCQAGLPDPTDPCPAAVSGPKAIAGNCSTRDGRSRVTAPCAPHVTWTTRLPVDSFAQVGSSAIATDASGNAYVVVTESTYSASALRRVRASDGAIEWTDPIQNLGEIGMPIILSHGGVDFYDGETTQTNDALFTFDPATGASTSTTFGFDLGQFPASLAVGSDGSLYVTHGVDNYVVSRVAPGGNVLWTSVHLDTLGPQDAVAWVGQVAVALAKDDLVIFAGVMQDYFCGYESVTIALDPATGAVRWSTVLSGRMTGGPVVRADGSIVELVESTNLVVFDPQSGTPTTRPFSGGVLSFPSASTLQIAAVAVDGTVIGAYDNFSDNFTASSELVAIGSDATVLWHRRGVGHGLVQHSSDFSYATIASDGTVISFGSEITALDSATGRVKWQLAPPVPGQCILDGALASDGSIVALQCDGTLFGASD